MSTPACWEAARGVREEINSTLHSDTHDNTVSEPSLPPWGERERDSATPLCVDGQDRKQTRDTSYIGHQTDEPRVRCGRCTLGAFMSCPSGKPLPGHLLNNCAHHQPRKPSAPDARVLVQPGRVGLPMSCKAFREFINTVHAEDEEKGRARLMKGTSC